MLIRAARNGQRLYSLTSLAHKFDTRRAASSKSTTEPEEGSTALVGRSYSVTKDFEPEEIALFLDICGDSNPIHIDFEAAVEAGFPGIILPGLLCASLFPGLIGSAFPGAIYATQSLRFVRPALATEPVRAVVDIDSAKRGRLSFRTQCLTVPEGKLLVDGTAVALLRGQTASTAPSGQA